MIEPNPIINDILIDISKTEINHNCNESEYLNQARKFLEQCSKKYNYDELNIQILVKKALDQWEENFHKIEHILEYGPYKNLLNDGRITQQKFEELEAEYFSRYSEIKEDILGGDNSEYNFRYHISYFTKDLNTFIRYAHPDKIFIEEVTPVLRQLLIEYEYENYTLKVALETLLFGGNKRKLYEMESDDEELH